jgi:hypothetical protein
MHVNAKMIPVETTPWMEGGKEEQRRGWVYVWYSWWIVRTFINATVYSHPAQE